MENKNDSIIATVLTFRFFFVIELFMKIYDTEFRSDVFEREFGFEKNRTYS